MNKTGFGFLRLPHLDGDEKQIDYNLLARMVDYFLTQGGIYFDTAYTYLEGVSEAALRKTVVERYPREAYRLADKLPLWDLQCRDDCERIFLEQQARCGVEWFDYYLLHGLNQENYNICRRVDAFAFMRELKERGLARQIGFSYHDSPELLDRILTEHPEMEFVQLQINYLDWDSPSIQAAACYEVACRHSKPVVVMEPVKGGMLAQLPPPAETLLYQARPQDSNAAWAIRFAQDLEQVAVVLSGMNTMAQLTDNMQQMLPLTDDERVLLARAADIIRSQTAVDCTGCNYCAAQCPQQIPISRCFGLYNEYRRSPGELWKSQIAYAALPVRASACIGCGACESVCPQKLPIRKALAETDQALQEK